MSRVHPWLVIASGLFTLGQTSAVPETVHHAHTHHRHHEHARARCVEQSPQSFLVRANANRSIGSRARSLEYRTRHYGRFGALGEPSWNVHPPGEFALETHFFGLAVRLHRDVVPVLACVESAVRAHCTEHYEPHRLSGLRNHNTYRGGEVSNHVYGIAIDIDSDRNPCCGCVPPWSDAPACRRHVRDEYERMELPRCWVEQFERFGFYWLGHDAQLRDTMHFEFLGAT